MLKRIRDRLDYRDIKYFMCGEYGPKGTRRPHYHAIIFGLTYEEAKKFFETKSYKLEDVEKNVWQKGHTEVGYSFTPEDCAYVAQYTMKKLKNKEYPEGKIAPYLRCSKGIGLRYAIDNRAKLLDKGYIEWQGHKYPLPRYYFKKWDVDRQEYYAQFIEDQTERLVNIAEKEGIPVFQPRGDETFPDWQKIEWAQNFYQKVPNMLVMDEAKKIHMEKAIVEGRVLYYKGEWYETTLAFWQYCNSIAKNVNLKIVQKWKDKREKLE
jgi:hypothetical protein